MLLHYLIVGLALVTILSVWLGWQLLRQNGRMLLRLDELERRLDELEFGDEHRPEGLAIGSEAPSFELPDLTGVRRSLAQYRGRPLLLMFFNPACGFCRDLLPKLSVLLSKGRTSEGGASEGRAPRVPDFPLSQVDQGLVELGPPGAGRPFVLLLTTGDAQQNRKFFAEQQLDCPILLQNDGEVATAYQARGTPSGYLVAPNGRIASELVLGAEALLKLAHGPLHELDHPLTPALSPNGEEGVRRTGEGESLDRIERFKHRSLARSRIQRDGLKAGTQAPDFRLPRLDGRGELTLGDLRGKRVVLVFSSPHCGPCETLAPELEKFHRQNGRSAGAPSPRPSPPGEEEPSSAVEVVVISKGEPGENRAKVKEYRLTFPIVLQQQWEISRRYAMFATPVAYLIDEQGVIARDVAVGVEPIRELLQSVNAIANRPQPALV